MGLLLGIRFDARLMVDPVVLLLITGQNFVIAIMNLNNIPPGNPINAKANGNGRFSR